MKSLRHVNRSACLSVRPLRLMGYGSLFRSSSFETSYGIFNNFCESVIANFSGANMGAPQSGGIRRKQGRKGKRDCRMPPKMSILSFSSSSSVWLFSSHSLSIALSLSLSISLSHTLAVDWGKTVSRHTTTYSNTNTHKHTHTHTHTHTHKREIETVSERTQRDSLPPGFYIFRKSFQVLSHKQFERAMRQQLQNFSVKVSESEFIYSTSRLHFELIY